VRALFVGNLIAGRLKLSEGDLERAAEYLERARPLLEEAAFPDWTGRFERLQLELWLAQDRLRAAVNWADALLPEDASNGCSEDALTQLTIARVLLVKGDATSIDRAQALLEALLRVVEAEGRMGIQVETLALLALAHWRRGEQAGALTTLERALRPAEPEGYVRLFVDLGLPMARLLQEARSRVVLPDYVARLLAAYGPSITLGRLERALPEPLTTRELEILDLLAAGLTNREIGDRLFISPQTVKKHTGGIYGKLGVRSRTQAVARARELDLLG
jgi:LuxR family maltose regulon positive regulatory protein